MPDLSTEPRARLFTVFGTVLFVDPASGTLRHGPIESSPANAYFAAAVEIKNRARQGWLIHDKGDSSHPIVCRAELCETLAGARVGDQTAEPSLLDLVPLERGLVAMRVDGTFISSFPDGRVKLIAPRCNTWE